jgi:hypothetical protein
MDALDVIDTDGQELVRVQATTLAVVPQVEAGELVQRLAVIRDAMRTAMQRDVDYGVIPGTDKPALFKPGAEKLSVLFQLDVQVANEKTWGPGDHLLVESKALVYHAPSGQRLGSGEGLCSTREKKYAWRNESRKCPNCGVAAIIRGKPEYGGGWVCWKKKPETPGCGSKFHDGDPAIEKAVGQIPNPDLPDLYNTVVKMAQKRARVDAVLAVTGASALFTQDVGDDGPLDDEPQREPRSDVTPPEPLAGLDAGLRLVRDADAAGIGRDTLRQAAEHLYGGALPRGEAGNVLGGQLTRIQAERLANWIQRKAAEAQPDDTPIDHSPAARLEALLEAGCICSEPGAEPYDENCPLHGVPEDPS